MRTLVAIVLACACLSPLLAGVRALDAVSKVAKSQLQPEETGFRSGNGGHRVRAFVRVSGNSDIEALQLMGVTVEAVFDGFVTASVPVRDINAVAALEGVKQISLARTLHLCNDSARHFSHVDQVLGGEDMPAPLDGKGVIIGIIDTGIDFNHINLCDAQGNSRIRAVYMPEDSTGVSPVIDGRVMPGSCYETPEQIARLETDYDGSSHGTHTAGTAAGSHMANGWHGVALQADIVACAMPEDKLTDVNIANGLKYIFDYAGRQHRPCVINMSIGTNEGPNDATSFLCKVFESMSGPGRICVLSAGNDGNAPICFHHTLSGVGDTVTTLLRNQWGGTQSSGYISMWSDGSQQHLSRLVIVNKTSGAIVYATPFLDALPGDSVFTVSSDDDPAFATHFTGKVQFANALEPQFSMDGPIADTDGRFHSFWTFDAMALDSQHVMGLQYLCDRSVHLTGWSTKYTYFYDYGLDGIIGGTRSGSISDLATTDSVISVGAYCSRSSYVERDGSIYSFSSSHPVDIAGFSSFGPDENGHQRPDVCAPGMAVVSSANRYNVTANREHWPEPVVVDGVEYPYYANQGTSMSAPLVTGTIALMLQLNPWLTASDVRGVLCRSSHRDDFVVNGDASRWGFGKLNALAAIGDVIENTLAPGDVTGDREVNIADVMAAIDIILRDGAAADAASLIRADVNHDSEVLIADVNAIIDLILND